MVDKWSCGSGLENKRLKKYRKQVITGSWNCLNSSSDSRIFCVYEDFGRKNLKSILYSINMLLP